MKEAHIRELYRQVWKGVLPHGDFLTALAEAISRADSENFKVNTKFYAPGPIVTAGWHYDD